MRILIQGRENGKTEDLNIELDMRANAKVTFDGLSVPELLDMIELLREEIEDGS